jgi:hypothetical protein
MEPEVRITYNIRSGTVFVMRIVRYAGNVFSLQLSPFEGRQKVNMTVSATSINTYLRGPVRGLFED